MAGIPRIYNMVVSSCELNPTPPLSIRTVKENVQLLTQTETLQSRGESPNVFKLISISSEDTLSPNTIIGQLGSGCEVWFWDRFPCSRKGKRVGETGYPLGVMEESRNCRECLASSPALTRTSEGQGPWPDHLCVARASQGP